MARLKGIAAAITLCLMPVSAFGASYEFTWTGSNGYTMNGALSIADNLANAMSVTTDDIQCFRIEGFKDGKPIGSWHLGQLTDDTSWHLNFSPRFRQFLTGGSSVGPRGQEWNMNGRGNNCGADGFGFNSGKAAQDVCIDNRLIRPSQIAYDTLLTATRNDDVRFGPNDCIGLRIS